MSVVVLTWGLTAAQLMLTTAMCLAVWRMARGPRAQDRVLGLDTLYSTAMLLVLVFGVQTGRVIYFEMALIIALLGFAATAALAKFLMRGEVIE
jgi:multicomponent K+:H+ antiporter subunit F